MSNWWMTWAERIALVLAELWARSKAETDGAAEGDHGRPVAEEPARPPDPSPPGAQDADAPR